jgi:hypothetical protein
MIYRRQLARFQDLIEWARKEEVLLAFSSPSSSSPSPSSSSSASSSSIAQCFSIFLLGTFVSNDDVRDDLRDDVRDDVRVDGVQRRRRRKGSLHLWKLVGQGGRLKRKIAAFLGVKEANEEFRNVREALAVMEEVLRSETRWRLRPEHLGFGPNWGCTLQ